MYNFLASFVVVLHITFVAWVLVGGFFARKSRIATMLQLFCLLWGILITWFGFPCPLTDLEKMFLSLAGEQSYEGEFLPHYLWSKFQISQGPILAIVMLILLFSLNIVAYFPIIKAKIRYLSNR